MHLVRPPLIELRQYVIAPGKRDRMIELFDTHFATAQDELGLPILGQFRVHGDPDRLVWLRGLPDMASRPERLGAFYGGPVWAEFGAEAIGIVTGYDNVQLLHEAAPGSGVEVDLDARPAAGAGEPCGLFSAVTYRLAAPAGADLVARCQARLGDRMLGLYVSDPTPNNFPPLPIREGEHLLTWLVAGDTQTTMNDPALHAAPERLLLRPTARSVLR